jgi:hypothetical protein
MNSFLVLLVIIAMIGTVVMLVRGIIAFLKTTEAALKSDSDGKEAMLRQNKMMTNRILFQGVAILLMALLLLMGRS